MSLRTEVMGALAPYDPKAQGANQYRMNSPFRPGANSHSFVLTFEDEDKGAWFDHVEDKGGSLFDLAKHLGIDVPTGKQVAPTKRKYKDLADYALSHGVPAQILHTAKWQQVTKNGRMALEFPTRSGNRWRFLDGDQPYYISVNGYKKCWYGFNETVQGMLNYGASLVLCNGEISTVVAQAYGLAAVCVTSGEGVIPENLLADLKTMLAPHPNAKIVIALDCDDKGRKATDALNKQLAEAGFNVSSVDLGLSKGGDLADWLTLYGWERMGEAVADFDKLQVIKPYVYVKRKKWEVIHASQLDNLPQVKWLIKGEIPDNGITVIFGASGAGKSFITLDYALRVAQFAPVVYVAAEGESGYQGRVKAWCAYHARNVGQLYMCLGAVSMLEAEDVTEFIYEIQKIAKSPRMIVVDTLARSMLGGDENSSRDMGHFINRCDELRQRFNCGVVIVHHSNKAGIVERGSNALRGAADSMIRVSNDDDLILVESSKSKDYAPFEPKWHRLQPVDVGMTNEDGESIMPMVPVLTDPTIQTDLEGMTRNQRKVLATCGEFFEFGFTIVELNEVLPEYDRGSLYRITTRLRKLGYIHQPAKRDPYELTPKARQLLNITDVAVVADVAVWSTKYKDKKSEDVSHTPNQHNRNNRNNQTLFEDSDGETKPNRYFEGGL